MAVSAMTSQKSFSEGSWLYHRNWDLTFISLNVVLVALPYLAYLGLLQFQTLIQPLADTFGASPESISRNLVNFIVALAIGGPHMYATFTRTSLDNDFRKKYPLLVWSSLLIPLIVIILALTWLELLLTVFFFWASIHVLHQIIYIVDLYNHKQKINLSRWSRAIDYGIVLTSLYPLAALKISQNEFSIGPNNISEVVGQIIGIVGLERGPWMVWLAGGAFAIAASAWLVKTIIEITQGTVHWPKTIFIFLTVLASFFVPILGNLDTAFQGMNVWHSMQYLSLTWMLNHLRQQRGELEATPFVERLSTDGTSRKFYLFNVGLTVADIALAGVIFVILRFVVNQSFDFAFDRAYYIAVLSFLWMHYFHDHFLFTQPDVITGKT